MLVSNGKFVVLVVEDEPLLRMNTVDMVEEAGFDAIEAANSAEALRLLESRSDIRIIFADIEMPPGIDGMKLVAMARDRHPPIEIILASGRVFPADVRLPERGLFFSKPYKPDDVIAALRRFTA